MNLLAKHYFDFQSFVNLPHKSVQLHKTPPSQAGIDPSAAWAPKSMKLAGKNRSAPGARANRNNVEVKRSGGRYGIPSKMEFRSWGERHGELRSERIVPHKDTWMASLDGDFKHFYEEVEHGVMMHQSQQLHSEMRTVDDERRRFIPPVFSTHRLFTGRQKAVVKLLDKEIDLLLILTLAKPHNAPEFLTATVRAVRGLSDEEKPFVKLLLYDGIRLLEQRRSGFSKRRRSLAGHYHGSMSDSLASSPKSGASNVNRPAPIYPNHNGGPAGLVHAGCVVSRNGPRAAARREEGSIGDSIPTSGSSAEEGMSEIGESFLFMYASKRLQRCHLLVQVFIREGDDENERLVGYCVLGDVGVRYRPFDVVASALDKGAQHWQQALGHKGRPICGWHRGLPVRPNLGSRMRRTAAMSEENTPSGGGRSFTPDLAELKLREARVDLGVCSQVSSSLPSMYPVNRPCR